MSCGSLPQGSITAAAQVNQYTFSGQANENVTLTLARTGGFGSSFAFAGVFAPSGKSVVGFNANGQQQLTLTETGIYVVKVESSNFADAGQYNLGLVCRAPQVQPSTAMSCGSLPQGSITAAAQVNQYTFSGQANRSEERR